MPAPQLADIFLIPLLDGDFGIGQVAEVKTTPPGTALCLLTLLKSAPDWPPSVVHYSEVISLLLLQTGSITSDTWQTVGFEAVPDLSRVVDTDNLTPERLAELNAHDPAIVEAFLNACHGL